VCNAGRWVYLRAGTVWSLRAEEHSVLLLFRAMGDSTCAEMLRSIEIVWKAGKFVNPKLQDWVPSDINLEDKEWTDILADLASDFNDMVTPNFSVKEGKYKLKWDYKVSSMEDIERKALARCRLESMAQEIVMSKGKHRILPGAWDHRDHGRLPGLLQALAGLSGTQVERELPRLRMREEFEMAELLQEVEGDEHRGTPEREEEGGRRTAPPSPRGDEYVQEQAATAEAGDKVTAAKRAADELDRKAKEAAKKAQAGAKAAADLEEMWKKAAGGGEEAGEEEPERTKEQEDRAMYEMLRGLSGARARAEKRLKKELRAKLKRVKTASIGERKKIQSEIEQLRSKLKRVEAEQAMEELRKEKEERDKAAEEPAGDIPPEEPASPQVPSPKVKEELKKEHDEKKQEKADRMLERERERVERLKRLMEQTPAVDLTGEVDKGESAFEEEEEGDTYPASWYAAMVKMHAQAAKLRETTRVCARHTPNESIANKRSVEAAHRDANAATLRAEWAAQYLAEAEESEKEEAAARAAAAREAADAEEKLLFDLLDRIREEAALDADAAEQEAREKKTAANRWMREEGERVAAQLGAAQYAAGRTERERRYRQMLRQQVHVYKLKGVIVKAQNGYPEEPAKAGDETAVWVESIRHMTQYRRLEGIKAERAAEKKAKPVEKAAQVEPPPAPVPPPAIPTAAVPLAEEDEDEEPLFNIFEKDEAKAKAEEARLKEEEAKRKQEEKEAKKRKRQEEKDRKLAIQLSLLDQPRSSRKAAKKGDGAGPSKS
jgi:hypothetical protein